jgi:hypothetical protein
MYKKIGVLCIICCALFLYAPAVSFAGEAEALMKLLLEKGIISQEEYEELKAEVRKKEDNVGQEVSVQEETPRWYERITVGGGAAMEYRWMKHRDITVRDSDSTSDLYVRAVELSLEAGIADWITASLTVNSEWIGDDVNQGDEKISLDEAVVTLQKEGVPFYLTAGKRTQPFGLFENHLVTDPMTQDAYEIKKAGVTAGYTGPAGADISLTVYKGEEQMTHLFESGLFSDAVSRSGEETDDLGSFILSVSVMPVEDSLTIFGAYVSETGRDNRNDSVNIGVNFVPRFIEHLRIDAEYMGAIKREEYTGMDEEFKEGVYSVTAAYELILRKREVIGGRLFAERKAHIVSEPLELAVRYEHFDDDSLAESTGTWSVKDRYSAGARYSFYNDETRGLNAFLAAEYRRTEMRVDSASVMDDSNDEFYTRLGVNF